MVLDQQINRWAEQGKKRVLICPLNWGLGHAARCIPIIKSLLAHGIEVDIGSDGQALTLLREEFPKLEFLDLPGYNVTYPYQNILFNLFNSGLNILRGWYREHGAVEKWVESQSIDVVISDNRFGCRSRYAYNIYLTHQLSIQMKSRLWSWIADFFHHQIIAKYDRCWVPDHEAIEKRLSGKLADAGRLKDVLYIGPLSRFVKKNVDPEYDITAVLSGPEPQRTKLESKLLPILSDFEGKVCFIRGLPGSSEDLPVPDIQYTGRITVKNFMTAKELNAVLLASKVIITRTGYTSIMDLETLEKSAILIPTPGQSEQEYLGRYHEKNQRFQILDQRMLNSLPDLLKPIFK